VNGAADPLLVEIDGGIARLTFNNPRRHNALTIAMASAVVDVLGELEAATTVRVVTLTGAGRRAFMSGADLVEQSDEATSERSRQTSLQMLDALGAFPKPLIAVIPGHCLGGGLLVAMTADIRVAEAKATFGVPAARLGIGYRYADVARMAAAIGPGNVAELLFSARPISADEAKLMGLIEHVWPDPEVGGRADDLARSIAASAPLSVRAAKAAIRATRGECDVTEVDRLRMACWASSDYEEGKRAFAERRKAHFTGT
jgi:enoyl-CoA hydratase/carnithine racemase